MEDYTNTKIFYKNLLSVDIESILQKNIDEQKTVSIDIKPIKEKSSSSLYKTKMKHIMGQLEIL